MDQPPKDPLRLTGDPRGRRPTAGDPPAEPPAETDAPSDDSRRKAALRRFVDEHREWLEEMSQH